MPITLLRYFRVLLLFACCLITALSARAEPDTPTKTIDSPATIKAEQAFDNGYRQLERKEFEKAVESFNTVVKIEPENIGAYYNRGLASMMCRRFTKAIEDFDAVLERDPRHADALFCRGMTRKGAGDFAAAAHDMEAAAEIDPSYREAATYGRGTWVGRWLLYGVLAVGTLLCAGAGLHLFRLFRQFR